MTGTVPVNNKSLTGMVPVNKESFTGMVPGNNLILISKPSLSLMDLLYI